MCGVKVGPGFLSASGCMKTSSRQVEDLAEALRHDPQSARDAPAARIAEGRVHQEEGGRTHAFVTRAPTTTILAAAVTAATIAPLSVAGIQFRAFHGAQAQRQMPPSAKSNYCHARPIKDTEPPVGTTRLLSHISACWMGGRCSYFSAVGKLFCVWTPESCPRIGQGWLHRARCHERV